MKWPKILLVLAIIFLVFHGVYYFNFVVDDAFIAYRYAENLAAGNGLVFNVGERVEGYSNFLYIVIVAFIIKFFSLHGLSLFVAAKIFGILCSIITFLVVLQCAKLSEHKEYSWLPAALLITSPFFALWSVGGLETAFYGLLLMSAVYFYLKERSTQSFYISAIFFALAALTRSEALLYFLVAVIHRLYFDFKGKISSPKFLKWLGTFLLIFGPYFAWRFSYYGDLLPNTFYAKTSGGMEKLVLGWFRFVRFIRDSGGFFFYLIAIIPVCLKRNYYRSFLLAILAAGWFFAIYSGGDWMLGYRFLVPFLPIIYLLFRESAIELSSLLERFLNKKILTLILVVFILGNLMVGWDYMKTNSSGLVNFYREQKFQLQWYFDFGRWLKKNVPADATIAQGECGIIPYFSELYVIDFFGLVDPHISRLKGLVNRKTDVDYVLKRKPDYILTASEKYSYTKNLLKNKEFIDNYYIVYQKGQFVLYERRKK